MKKIIIINILILITSCQLSDPEYNLSDYLDSIKYLQFENGNYWIYNLYSRTWEGRESNSIIKSIFDGSEIINSKKYLRLLNINSKNDSSYNYFRIDQDTGYLYSYDKSKDSEVLRTFLSSKSGEYEIDYDNYPESYKGVNISEEIFDRFDENVTILKHIVYDNETRTTYKYSDKYGYIDSYFSYLTSVRSRKLLGCFINSVVYGDTTFQIE